MVQIFFTMFTYIERFQFRKQQFGVRLKPTRLSSTANTLIGVTFIKYAMCSIDLLVLCAKFGIFRCDDIDFTFYHKVTYICILVRETL